MHKDPWIFDELLMAESTNNGFIGVNLTTGDEASVLDVTALDICRAGGHWGIKELDIVRGLEPIKIHFIEINLNLIKWAWSVFLTQKSL